MKRFFWKISSGDWVIIEQCAKGTQRLFLIVGIWVLLLFGITLVSTFYAFEQIFHDTAVDMAIALFFGFAIFNIYLFLLMTLTKNVLPHVRYGETTLSLIGRVLFLAFLAVIISKPLEEYIFRDQLNAMVANYKAGLIDSVETSVNAYYDKEIQAIENDIKRQKGLHAEGSLDLVSNLNRLNSKKTSLAGRRNKELAMGKAQILEATFFMQRIRFLVGNKPLSYLVSLLMIILFVLPVYVKFRIRDSQDYFALKEKYETELVVSEYENFKRSYSELFQREFAVEVTFQEKFKDPPFNTEPSIRYPSIGSESDFLKDLYNV